MKSNDAYAGDLGPGGFAEPGEQPLDPGMLASLGLYPNAADMDRGFKLVASEISQMFRDAQYSDSLAFAFCDTPDYPACSEYRENLHTIRISVHLYKRLEAVFRQLSLTNAFGKYAQTTNFDRDELAQLLTLPEIEGVRIREDAVPVESLLNTPGSAEPDNKQLDAYLSRPPMDAKHRFDIQSLMVPALTFAFWHELAHVLIGHNQWMLETDQFETHALGLEYIADFYAAERIAHDILQSALREVGCYVIGPFWFNRSGFEAVGKLEGIPGESIEFNLEGFMYRIAFALQVLIYHFPGFLLEPVTHRKMSHHPHPEVRLSRIVEAIKRIMLAAPIDPPNQGYLAEMWDAMFGYAMFTAQKALETCHTRQPGDWEKGLFGDMFHAHEIQAIVRASNQRVEDAEKATASYSYKDVLAALKPRHGVLTFPRDRAAMVEIADDFPSVFERGNPKAPMEELEVSNLTTGVQHEEEYLTIDELADVLAYGAINHEQDDDWNAVAGLDIDKQRFYFERDCLRAGAITLSLARVSSMDAFVKMEAKFWNRLGRVNPQIGDSAKEYARIFMNTYQEDKGNSVFAEFSRRCSGGAEYPELMEFARKIFVTTLKSYRGLLKNQGWCE